MKVGQKVMYPDPVKIARGEKSNLHEWKITSIWSSNTEDGDIVGLCRKDDSKVKGEDKCNVLLNELIKINK